MALQPLPKSLATRAKQKGGDLLGFDDDIDRIIFELDYSYVFEDLDSDTVDGAMVQAYSGLQTLVNGVSDRYPFQPWTAYRVAVSQQNPERGPLESSVDQYLQKT